MSYNAQPFTISADSGDGPRSATRHQAASAMCLADDWAEAGCWNVQVTDSKGVARDRQQFRATLPLAKWVRRVPQ